SHGERVPWCSHGFYLDERQPFTFDPLLHAGAYYVQDASSMIIEHIVGQLVTSPVRYLDLCAAPGGKTTAAINALPEGSLMVTNEIMPDRARVLLENVVKWGNPNCVVTSDSSDRLGTLTHFFDVVAADVPCSGEGMFRKDAEAVAQWTPRLVEQCAERQREIIGNIWHALRPGGIFIYSTCTYNRTEDEAMVEHIMAEYGAESIDMHFPEEWRVHPAIGTDAHCYRFMPHRTRGEGLFVAVLRKPGDEPHAEATASGKKGNQGGKKKLKGNQGKASVAAIPAEAQKWLCGDFILTADAEGSITATPQAFAGEIAMLRSAVRVLHAGVEVATIKGHDAVPAQSLALSTALNGEAFARVELDYPTAIAYLRGESITLTHNAIPRGIVAVSYRGMVLGFVKNLGNRANNLYPREWRIKSTHAPATPPQIL
ncbi:MAG: rRNA cytosine-C5-methyltransferase, partial [Muribaculaceae bacterium]